MIDGEKCQPCAAFDVDVWAVTEWGIDLIPVCYYHILNPHDTLPVDIPLSETTCVIKDTPDGKPCGKPTYTKMLNEYLFSIGGTRYQFELTLCVEHYAGFIANLQEQIDELQALES